MLLVLGMFGLWLAVVVLIHDVFLVLELLQCSGYAASHSSVEARTGSEKQI